MKETAQVKIEALKKEVGIINDELLEYILNIRQILQQKKIRSYAIYFIGGGFGDIMTNAAIQSFFCDLFGLNFECAVKGYLGDIHGDFYEKFLCDYGIKFFSGEIFYIEVENILQDIQFLIKSISRAPIGCILCIKKASKEAFYYGEYADYLVQRKFNVFENQFISFFKQSLSHYGFYDGLSYPKDKMRITFHIRLGDNAVVPINESIIVPLSYFWKTKNCYYDLAIKQGNRNIINQYLQVNEILNLASQLNSLPNVEVNLISDGFDKRAITEVTGRGKFLQTIKRLGLDYDEKIMWEYIDSTKKKLDSFVGTKVIGESYEDFIASIRLLLTSSLCITSSRSFVWRALTVCKRDTLFRQKLLMGSMLKECTLQQINIELSNFKVCDENLLDNIFQKEQEQSQPKITTKEAVKEKVIIKQIPIPSIYLVSKDRIHNHLAYKLGSAMILNSKSLLGYIRMPYVLSYIKEAHRKEIAEYEARVAKNPSLKLPKLESYVDYKEALKEKECFTYKLGEALIKANSVRGGGRIFAYLAFFQEVRRLKREFREKRK